MKIATCLTGAGTVGNPFDADSVCVYERLNNTWVREKEFSYRPEPDMGISQARLLLRSIASQITDCEVFLVNELQGFTHVWLEELGFRTWKSGGSLNEQLENVAALDALAFEERRLAAQHGCESKSASGGCGSGCGGGCGGFSHSTPVSQQDFETTHPIPSPIPVGDASNLHFRIDLAAIMELDPILNSRQVIIPFLEKRNFRILEVHLSHVPKWFYQTLDQLDLVADLADSVSPVHGIDARITLKPKK